jgi:hypothetical protein
MFNNERVFQAFLFVLGLVLIPYILKAETEIKSLRVYSYDNQISMPFISGDPESLTIEFDVKSDYEPMFNIIFKFCDRNWNPYDNIFLMNNGYNTVYQHQLFFESLPPQVKEADYHLKESFPNDKCNIEFPFSGKWKFFITESNDTSKIYAEGKFIVINNMFDVFPKIKNETLEKIFYPTDLNKIFKISLDFELPGEFYPDYIQGIEIIENHKIEYPYYVDRIHNNDYHAFYWDGNRKFSFMTRDIKPGNSYRETDLRNTTINMSKQVNAQFKGIDDTRFYTHPKEDLKGGSIVPEFSEEFATYLDVKFWLRLPPEVNANNIFVVGAFNDWQVLPGYEMEYQNGFYVKTVQLKRGIYDYQYVTADLNYGKIRDIDWYVLEGNNWDVKKDYYIFLWYSDPDKGGYDRIIAYQPITSK